MKNAEQCNLCKCGEYNMLRCCRDYGHSGECVFVIDHDNDYPWNFQFLQS